MVSIFDKFFPKTPFSKFIPVRDPNTIFLRSGKKKFASISSQLQRIKTLPKPIRILASPTLTSVLSGTLAGLVTGSPLTGLKTFGGVGLGLGIATTSPKAVSFIKRKAKPVGAGEFVGSAIESIGKQSKKSLSDTIKEGAKKAGLLGAGVAAGAGAIVAGKKLLEKVKVGKTPDLSTIIPRGAAVSTIQQQPSELQPQFQSFGAAEKPPKEEKVVPVTQTMPTINNRISVKPEINISFRKSRKFINQQIFAR